MMRPADVRKRYSPAEGRSRTSGALRMSQLDAPRTIPTVRGADALRVVDQVVDVVPRTRSERLNRAVNLTLALTAVTVLAPVFLAVAVAVKLTSRGPIFYRQARVGIDRRWNETRAMYDRRLQDLGGQVFSIYKFRSMFTNAEHRSGAVWAVREDPRVTPIGKFLRQFRLDELPQLINVIKGDMNIVGPRPERPSIFLRLCNDIAEYPMRQRSKPGITGWAQINQSYDASIDDVRRKVAYDLQYIERQGLAVDMSIMLKTLPVMIFKRGSL